jgi:CHAT domain-containing protein
LSKRSRTGDLRFPSSAHDLDPYGEAVSLLCSSEHDARGAAEIVDRAKSMTLHEFPKIVKYPADKKGSEMALPAGMLTIDYYFTADELYAFISIGNRIEAVPLGTTDEEIGREVNQCRSSIMAGDEKRFRAISRRLNDRLIEPIFSRIKNERFEHLVIMPDGPLNRLPFDCLENARGQYLIERAVISFAPSRSVLRHCLSLGRENAGSNNRSVLFLDGSINLPAAGDELALLSSFYRKNHTTIRGENLVSAPSLMANAEIIHFAGHAIQRNGKPALILQNNFKEILLGSDTISTWNLSKNRLINLAGCETGTGQAEEGNTPWGLVPAFLNADAPAVIVSLLPVNDASTKSLTHRFYELLAGGSTSKASALRQAQLLLLASMRSGGRSNPSSWAPYVLVGDPR